MKTRWTLLIFLCLGEIYLYAQINIQQFEALEKKVQHLAIRSDSLQNKYVEVDNGRRELKNKLLQMYRSELKDLELTIKDAFDKTDVISISAAYQEIIKSIITLHNEITRINNFTDAEKIFGVDFVDQLTKIVESTLIAQIDNSPFLQNEKAKKRRIEQIRLMVKNILVNPVITGLLKSNPITSVAHSIINQVFSSNDRQLEDVVICRNNFILPENYKDFKDNYPAFKSSFESTALSYREPVNEDLHAKSIASFTNALSPLIKLFDELEAINDKYASSLEVFMKASEQTINRVKPLEQSFYRMLNAKNRQEARKVINQFFNIGQDPSLDVLEEKLNDEMMKRVLIFSGEVDEGLLLLKNDFLKIITLEIELALEYISFFRALQNGQEGLPDFEKTDALEIKILQFEQLVSSLKQQKVKLEEIDRKS